ncbi:MAG: MarR family transcriptional regulator [Phototrophicaceae bacterium]
MTRHDDINSINNATAFIILRTARLLRFHLNKVLEDAELGISAEQWFILFKLWETPDVPQNALADPVLNDEPNITRLLNALEAQGLITRTVDTQDKRRKLISLSSKGHAMMEDFLPEVADIRKQVFTGIADNEIEQLVDMLNRVENNII